MRVGSVEATSDMCFPCDANDGGTNEYVLHIWTLLKMSGYSTRSIMLVVLYGLYGEHFCSLYGSRAI